MDRDKVTNAINKKAPAAKLSFGALMSGMTSLGIGGAADLLVRPSGIDETAFAVAALKELGLDCTVVGGGTNLLVRDSGIKGAVLHLAALDELMATDMGDSVLLRVGAGLPMNKLLGYMRKEGLSGLEGLVGIPGFVGGAIAGNAGSFGCQMMDAVIELDVIRADGTVGTIKADELTPAYRDAGLPAGTSIVGATLKLRRAEQREVAASMDEALKKKSATQPLGQRSAGCVFKNPEGNLSAGKLIDEAGFKGISMGGIEVSAVHAGFFINKGGGSSEDFMRLMDMVSVKVMKDFGVQLQPEIKVVGIDA